MGQQFTTGVGAVLSADIAVPDHERELRFYSRVLGTGESSLWREDLLSSLGVPIVGVGPRGEQSAQLPLQWMPHIQVADVAASAERARDLGGQELMHHRDDGGASQWAVLLDPNGAAFGVIPPVPAAAIPSVPDAADGGAPVGRIAWLDLTVPDASATRDFYRQVVGWSVQEVDMGDAGGRYADFNMLGEGGTPVAGVCHARGVNAGLPPAWMIYLPVGDLAQSLQRVVEEGGRVVRAARAGDGGVLYAAVQDPVGAYFALVPA